MSSQAACHGTGVIGTRARLSYHSIKVMSRSLNIIAPAAHETAKDAYHDTIQCAELCPPAVKLITHDYFSARALACLCKAPFQFHSIPLHMSYQGTVEHTNWAAKTWHIRKTRHLMKAPVAADHFHVTIRYSSARHLYVLQRLRSCAWACRTHSFSSSSCYML